MRKQENTTLPTISCHLQTERKQSQCTAHVNTLFSVAVFCSCQTKHIAKHWQKPYSELVFQGPRHFLKYPTEYSFKKIGLYSFFKQN